MKHNLHGPLKPLKNKIRKQSPTRAQPFAFFFFFFFPQPFAFLRRMLTRVNMRKQKISLKSLDIDRSNR
jgi:hypothetical protein